MRTGPGDRIGDALFGKGKRAILSLLLGHPGQRFFVRELGRRARVTPSTLVRDLKLLTDAGVILRTQEGRQVYYRANEASPVFEELRGLVTKTFGLVDVLRDAISSISRKIRVAAIYGSVASGTHTAQSDVDLLIVGEVAQSDFAVQLLDAEHALGRRIQPTVYPVREFAHNATKTPFLKAIMERPMIFLVGDKNELERIRKGKATKSR